MDKSGPVLRLKKILAVVWKTPVEYTLYASHHEGHEETIVKRCVFTSCPSWLEVLCRELSA